MRAARFHEFGPADRLVVEEVEDPVAGPGEVLVKVGACALNHLDVDLREGISRFPLTLPHVMGLELAGEIVAVGDGVSDRWKVGDRVAPYLMGTDPFDAFTRTGRENLSPSAFIGFTMSGGFAQLAAIPERHLVRTPDSLTDVQAAATQIAFATAYHMLFTRARLRMGETVMVNAVGSGIGSAAVQLARLAGATIIGNASTDEKLERARAMGMHHGINRTSEDVAARARELTGGRGVDVVFEHVGGAMMQASLAAVARDGRIVTCGGHAGEVIDFDIIPFFRNQTTLIGSFTFTSWEYEECLRLASLGQIEPVVDSVYPLDGIQDAFRRMEAMEHFGKIVITPNA